MYLSSHSVIHHFFHLPDKKMGPSLSFIIISYIPSYDNFCVRIYFSKAGETSGNSDNFFILTMGRYIGLIKIYL